MHEKRNKYKEEKPVSSMKQFINCACSLLLQKSILLTYFNKTTRVSWNIEINVTIISTFWINNPDIFLGEYISRLNLSFSNRWNSTKYFCQRETWMCNGLWCITDVMDWRINLAVASRNYRNARLILFTEGNIVKEKCAVYFMRTTFHE